MCYVNCNLCPRGCGVDRTAGEKGYCGCPDTALVAKTMLHKWEEPALAGNGGSGAIFFGGCTLGCAFCQNRAISGKPCGALTTSTKLRQIMEDLIAQGAENIDLVTPTQYLPTILPALEPKLPVPVVYNCGGYESVETLKMLEGKIQIYLPDMKYSDNALALRYSGAGNYVETAQAAIMEMYRQTGDYVMDDDGLLKSGVVIRHLILPGQLENSKGVIDWVDDSFLPGSVLFSLMSQYTPCGRAKEFPEINRRLTAAEYEEIQAHMEKSCIFEGFFQELESAGEEFIPDFDFTGIEC